MSPTWVVSTWAAAEPRGAVGGRSVRIGPTPKISTRVSHLNAGLLAQPDGGEFELIAVAPDGPWS